jgi:hypothetical protein
MQCGKASFNIQVRRASPAPHAAPSLCTNGNPVKYGHSNTEGEIVQLSSEISQYSVQMQDVKKRPPAGSRVRLLCMLMRELGVWPVLASTCRCDSEGQAHVLAKAILRLVDAGNTEGLRQLGKNGLVQTRRVLLAGNRVLGG